MPALAMLKSIVSDNDMHLENKLFCARDPDLQKEAAKALLPTSSRHISLKHLLDKNEE